jgi:hypothetical protein
MRQRMRIGYMPHPPSLNASIRAMVESPYFP